MLNMPRGQSVEALELNKSIIRNKLKNADKSIQKLEAILQRKSMKKGVYDLAPLPASETTVAIRGFPVEDFRMLQRSSKVITNPEDKLPRKMDPTVKSKGLESIHHRHLQRTVCKREVDRQIQESARLEKEHKAMEAKKAAKKERQVKVKPVVPESMLPNRYVRGELPCTIEHGTKGHYLSWACPLEHLDYEYYLPIFFDGLQVKENPTRFLARQGVEDMLFSARGQAEKIIPCVRSLVGPLRNAFMKFDADVLLGVLKALQQLLKSAPGVGEALLPFSKQFMAPMGLYLEDCKNIGDTMDYSQRLNNDIGENVRATLELFEENGGPKALKAIKFSVPTYQSCIRPTNFKREASTASTTDGGGSTTNSRSSKLTK
jgi:hypothetical protein